MQPSTDDAAPLLIAFTSFPGLNVRFGAWCEESYPVCGCDACDEDPESCIGSLRQRVGVVAAGRFREEITGTFKHWLNVEWVGDGWRSGGKGWLPRATFRRLEGRGRRDWHPWPVR